ncbi:targeting protein for Xklp2 homolog [Athalia rosae]|uniref:targeting protein for Xklp2 homolog n=1 Tax=Athalia rosae TaxID=37344 RepID=UPI002033CF50|nr:targeting protein for Xklp2 homolog [Athalia rosae]
MDGTWHLNAPQWADFASGPETPDDNYFDREYLKLEPGQPIKEVVPTCPTTPSSETIEDNPNVNLLIVVENNDSLVNEMKIAKMTPVKVVSPKLTKNSTLKETTYDEVLSEAMACLQLSVKHSRRSHRAKNTLSELMATPTASNKVTSEKSLRHLGPPSTPSNPIPMWLRKTKLAEKEVNKAKAASVLLEGQLCLDSTDQDNLMPDNIKMQRAVGVDIKLAQSTEQADINTQFSIETSTIEAQPKSSSPISAEPPAKRVQGISNIIQRSSGRSEVQQPRFPTCQLRRRSLTQYRRRSNKYVSMAEAISKFQTGTPERFRSVSSKGPKPGPLQKLRQSCISATVPISPALRCKSRVRPTKVLSQEERERLEMEEMKKNSLREHLARANSMKGLSRNSASKTTEKKPTKLPNSSQLVEMKTSNVPTTEKKSNRKARLKITVPSVFSTEEGLAVKDAEISNFGVPDITTAKQSVTKITPFSFEMRNKELQKRKEQKIQKLLTEEEQKTRATFHARPVPCFKQPMLTGSRESVNTKPKTKPCPFSFEERDKNLMKKKENYIKNVIEEDKKAREFQAKPVPEFKPVLVRGISKENLNVGHKPQKGRISMLPIARSGSKNCLFAKNNIANQENQNPAKNTCIAFPKQEMSKPNGDKNQLHQKGTTKVLTEFHLNTDIRAKERKEFDEKIKQKESEAEKMRKQAEMEQLKRAESERTEIRKMAETKARPMPVYKPAVLLRSTKPLTEPLSPAWTAKTKR